jgi:hypothetical protein
MTLAEDGAQENIIVTQVMIDAIHDNLQAIAPDNGNVSAIAGYVTGSGGIEWGASDWLRFPHYRHLRIDQSMAFNPNPVGYDIRDVEPRACPAETAAREAVIRAEKHHTKTIIYVNVSEEPNLAADVVSAFGAVKLSIDDAFLWLANWNLDQDEAASIIGTRSLAGFEIIGVQWASPLSNPDTVIPGTDVTLSEAEVDLSVINSKWVSPMRIAVPPPPKPPVY